MSNLPALVDSASPEFHFFLRRLSPCSRRVALHLTSALPPPLPIATSAPHPANVSSGDIDLRRLSPHPDGIRLVLELSVVPRVARLRLLAVSPSSALLTPLDSPHSALHSPRVPADTFFGCTRARARHHYSTKSTALPRVHAYVLVLESRISSITRHSSCSTFAPPSAPFASPVPSLALSPGSCRSFSGRVARHSAFGIRRGRREPVGRVLRAASGIQHM
ncbi:hypothetical protein DFH08DRAFT_948280 [Mycena albidolilacea]|uniref:Uncharacterized protein n=1 Tax=Mycena albidolilacea TaxID=1033008 RepID=A0AAD7ARK5_9AGAR|nr:hypothetical protein DFH08DRAFT_948280 [Mycena albidolilacea]